MNHPYAQYIESKADEYYARQVHESLCCTQQPYKPYHRNLSGQTYDVYIPAHCNCWLSDNWEDLDLARKFEALKDLSRRFGLHSAACSRLKTTPIIYRNKPDTLRYGCDCWLSVPIRPDQGKACPVCDKPLFYAPRAPEDTAKQACSDLECINAHGIIRWYPVDFPPEPPVDYNETPKEKEHTISDLSRAIKYAETFEQSQRDINNFLAPFAEDYAAFLTKDSIGYNRLRNFTVETFVEFDGESFRIQGEETYSHGEYDTPYLTLPFAFVENSQQYKSDILAKQAEAKAKEAARKAKSKAERVQRLQEQLAKAQAELDKALAAGTDDIKITAIGNQVASLAEKG